jgi:hypothetical protein
MDVGRALGAGAGRSARESGTRRCVLGTGTGCWESGAARWESGTPEKSKVVTTHRLMHWLGRFMVPCILVPLFPSLLAQLYPGAPTIGCCIKMYSGDCCILLFVGLDIFPFTLLGGLGHRWHAPVDERSSKK